MLSILFSMLIAGSLELTTQSEYNMSDVEVYYPTRIDVAPNGTLAMVVDARDKCLILLDEQGKQIARCGKKGEGPGEFGSPDEVQWLAEKEAFTVYDSDNHRFSLWDLQGKLVTEIRHEVRPRAPHILADQNMIFWQRGGTHLKRTVSIARGQVGKNEITKIWEYDGAIDMPYIMVDDSTVALTPPWHAYFAMGVGSDFIAVVAGNQPTITLLDFKGKQIGTIKPQIKTREISDDDLNEYVERMSSMFRSAAKNQADKLKGDGNFPLIMDLTIDDRDRIWVTGPSLTPGGPLQIHVLDRQGNELAQTQMAHSPKLVSDNRAYYFRENEDEELILVRAKFDM